MMAVALYIELNGKFPAGQSSLPRPDTSGTMHVFTSTAQFRALATALADYASALSIGVTAADSVAIP